MFSELGGVVSPLWALAGLAASAFLSATVLPGNSEAALVAVLWAHPTLLWGAVGVASLANGLGGLTSVWLGRQMPPPATAHRALGWVQRFGAVTLLLSWVPLLGDALCVAAGWLRLAWGPVSLWLVLGKTARYALLGWGALRLSGG